MSDGKTYMVLSVNECSRIVDSMETWMRLLNGVLTLNPNTCMSSTTVFMMCKSLHSKGHRGIDRQTCGGRKSNRT